jgi:hypothetical protein
MEKPDARKIRHSVRDFPSFLKGKPVQAESTRILHYFTPALLRVRGRGEWRGFSEPCAPSYFVLTFVLRN